MRKLKERSLYRHFKGEFYYVEKIINHTETGEDLVLYQALYGNKKSYARPLDMFLEEVPKDKENPTGQKYRFENMDNLGKKMIELEKIAKSK